MSSPGQIESRPRSGFWRELGAQAGLAGLSLVRNAWKGGRILPDAGTIGVIATNRHYEDPMAIFREIAILKMRACVWFDEHTLDAVSLASRIHFPDQGHSKENGSLLDSECDRLLPAEPDPQLAKAFPDAVIRKIVEGPSDPVRDYSIDPPGSLSGTAP